MSTGPFNIDDPNPNGRHGDKQPFAFDMGAAYGTPVLAARSGVVRKLEDDDNYNDMARTTTPRTTTTGPTATSGSGTTSGSSTRTGASSSTSTTATTRPR